MSVCDKCKHPEECQLGCYDWIYYGDTDGVSPAPWLVMESMYEESS